MARIILIDDDDALRTVLSMTLTQAGHTVTEARNGLEGLEQFHRLGADIVITDIVMPEKEGFEVLIELRKKFPAVKTIAITGGGRMGAGLDYLQMARLMGAARVLAKPFAGAALVAVVEELCPRAGAKESVA